MNVAGNGSLRAVADDEGTDELDALELELRRIEGVMGTAFTRGEPLRIQLLLTDPDLVEVVRERASYVVRRLLEGPFSIELLAAGAPLRPLAFETQVAALPAVRSCVAERGARGEVVSVAVTVTSLDAIEAAMDVLAREIGRRFPEDRVWVDLLPTT